MKTHAQIEAERDAAIRALEQAIARWHEARQALRQTIADAGL
jgi:hypothetical protein